MKRWVVGVDFGATNVKVGLVNPAGRVVASRVLSAEDAGRPVAFIEAIGQAVDALARSQGLRASQLAGVGVGAPGLVDVQRGIIHSLVNVPGWHEVALGYLLERRLRCRCLVENDVNLFVLGEWRFGAGRGSRHLVGLTLGTGVGGGLILNGALHRGTSGAAGEIGHMVIRAGGHRCACGRRGCLEAEVGTAAILRLGRAALRGRGRLTPAMISEAAQEGHRAARAVWDTIGASLGIGLANLINLLSPDRIVIGGGIAKAWRWFAPALKQTVRREAMSQPAAACRIVRAQRGDHAGILGAAVLIREQR